MLILSDCLEQVSLNELEKLVTNRISEGKCIEYKREFYRLDSKVPADKEKQHEEMLKDISSFANTLGGDLIIGISENDGVASEVHGFDVSDGIDSLKRRILDITHRWLEPRASIIIHSVDVGQKKAVLIIRIAKISIAPHRVIYKGSFGQFWARSSAGTYQMDTFDLRQAFTNSKNLEDQIEGFRTERIEAIAGNETLIPLSGSPKLICHLIPLGAFTSEIELTPSEIKGQLANLPLLHFTGGWSDKIQFDGLLVFDNSATLSSGYVKVFRNGIIESVADDITQCNPLINAVQIPYFKHDYVKNIISTIPNYLKVYAALNVQLPVLCCLTLTGVKDMRIYYNGFQRSESPVDSDIVKLEQIEITELSIVDCASILRPAFDKLWNAAGQERCFLYNEEGKFLGGFS
ncbi:ATP-binding protein [Gimesia sp.]|uniref:AlbA family DNA-binding domain-containing protein n=1 Tax=Gimesia sp. TaxID=2024833 RepID=UPI0025C545A7|nr:ATP-binding protein [Gimesia sp.]|tara:strand:+ start:4285 stop:5499 length:1215 start_codon:yes stop_codon:yes gene_type:complete